MVVSLRGMFASSGRRRAWQVLLAVAMVALLGLPSTAHPAGRGDRQESASLGHPNYDPPYTQQQPCQDATEPAPGPYDDCPPLNSLDDARSAAQLEHRYPSYFSNPGWPNDPFVLDDAAALNAGLQMNNCVFPYPLFFWGQQSDDIWGCPGGPGLPGQPKSPAWFPPGYTGPAPDGPEGSMTDYCNPQGIEPWPDPPLPDAGTPEVRWTDESPYYTGNQNFVDAGEAMWQLQEPTRWFTAPRAGEDRFHMEWSELGDSIGVPAGTVTLATSDDPHTIEGRPDARAIKLAWDGYILGRFEKTVEDLPVYDEPYWDDDRGGDIRLYLNFDNEGPSTSQGVPGPTGNFCLYGAGPEDPETGDGHLGPFYFIGTAMEGRHANSVPKPYKTPDVVDGGYPTGVSPNEFTFDLSYFYTPARMENGFPQDKAGLLQYVLIEASPMDAPILNVDFDWSPRLDDSLGADTGPTRNEILQFTPHVDRFGNPDYCIMEESPPTVPLHCEPHKEVVQEDPILSLAWCFGWNQNDIFPPPVPVPAWGTEGRCDLSYPTMTMPDGTPWASDHVYGSFPWRGFPGWLAVDEMAKIDNFADSSVDWRKPYVATGKDGGIDARHQFVVPGDYTVCLRAHTSFTDPYYVTPWNPGVMMATFDTPQLHVACHDIHIINEPPIVDFEVHELLGLAPRTYQLNDITTDPDWLQAVYVGTGFAGCPAKGSWKSMHGGSAPFPDPDPLPDSDLNCHNLQATPDAIIPDHPGRTEIDFATLDTMWTGDEWRAKMPDNVTPRQLPAQGGRYDDDGLVKWTWDFGDGTGYSRRCWVDLLDGDENLDLLKDSCPYQDVIEVDSGIYPWNAVKGPSDPPVEWFCHDPKIPDMPYSNRPPDCHLDVGADDLPDDELDIRNPRHTYKEDGLYLVTLTVEDADGGKATMTQAIFVQSHLNNPPILKDEPDRTVRAGTPITFTMSAYDADGDNLGYFWSDTPSWAVVDPITRTFQGTPMVPGTYGPFHWSVTDGEHFVSQELTITVYDNAVDSDLDGRTDVRDQCPSRPETGPGVDLGAGTGCPGASRPTTSSPTPVAPTAPVVPPSDVDGDKTPDALDVCPSIADDQADLDQDGLGDACDLDLDGDGVPQVSALQGAATDDCPFISDPMQRDADGDGTGDACQAKTVAPPPKPSLPPKEQVAEAKPKEANPLLGWEGAQLGLGLLLIVAVAGLVVGFALRRTRPEQ